MELTIDNIFALYKRKGYLITDFNIGGIRFNDNEDLFTDIRFLLRKAAGTWLLEQWKQTTKPGKTALLKPVNPLGCAVLKEGQYINCWQIGLHHGHNALIQCGIIEVFRDANDDGKIDLVNEKKAGPECGINLHGVWAANIKNWDGTYPNVGNWSEGCQVMARPSENETFIGYCKNSGLKWFTYSLFNINDLTTQLQ